MGIRVANVDDINKLAEQQKQIAEKEQLELSQEQLEYLYSKATIEIERLNQNVMFFKNALESFFYGKEILELETALSFFTELHTVLNNQIPIILSGDFDNILKRTEIITEEDCEKLRLALFKKLSEKYFK